MIEKVITSQDFFSKTLELALARHGLEVSVSAHDYLSRMLAHFSEHFILEQGWMQPITIQYQQVIEQTKKLQRQQSSRELGDHCLFLVGYFYDFVRRNGKGQVQYHADIGSSAYQQAGREPYEELAKKFSDLYVVIGDLHLPQLDEQKTLEIYERWEKTKDRYYASLLLGKGIVPREIKISNN